MTDPLASARSATSVEVAPASPARSTRERLIVEALDLFHAKGYHATGIQELVAAAGVPKGSFYHHFTNKQDLAVAALERYASASPNDVLQGSGLSAPAMIRSYFEVLAERFAATDRLRGCMMGNFATELADRDAELQPVLARLFTGWVDLLATVIAEGQREQSIVTSAAPGVLAESLISLWEGSLIQARATGSDRPLSTFFDVAFHHLIPPPTH